MFLNPHLLVCLIVWLSLDLCFLLAINCFNAKTPLGNFDFLLVVGACI